MTRDCNFSGNRCNNIPAEAPLSYYKQEGRAFYTIILLNYLRRILPKALTII